MNKEAFKGRTLLHSFSWLVRASTPFSLIRCTWPLLCLAGAAFLAGCVQRGYPPIRLAVVDRSQLQMATSDWVRRRYEQEIAKEPITPAINAQLEKVSQLQDELRRLEQELIRRRVESMRGGPPPLGPPPMDFRFDPQYQKLSEALAEARRPVAEIIDRRSRRQTEMQYPLKELIAEYAKDRFDVVLDRPFSEHSVLYRRAPDVVDITQGVLDLFRSKEK